MTAGTSLAALEALRFDNRALRELPTRQSGAHDDEETPLSLAVGACYVVLPPSSPPPSPPLPHLALLASSPPALRSLGLDPLDAERRPRLYASLLLGADGPTGLFPGAQPAAHVYSGHQFGFFAGLLGDGAALYVGEVSVVGVEDEHAHEEGGGGGGGGGGGRQRHRLVELNLEGAGPTPLTRQGRQGGGDQHDGEQPPPPPPPGRKTLLQAAREFLTSEALVALGVPATRSPLLGYCPDTKCATVLRAAPSFLRLGSLEVCRGASAATGRAGPSAPQFFSSASSSLAAAAAAAFHRPASSGPQELLPRLVDYAIRKHYPEVWRAFGGGAEEDDNNNDHDNAAAPPPPPPNAGPTFHLSADPETRADMVAAFLGELAAAHGRTAALWQAHGFVHGCPNSDNLAVAAETAAAGAPPAAATLNAGNCSRFLGRCDRAFSPHPLDLAGGYSYGSQPGAVRFALERLAEALGSASAMTAAGIAGVGGGGSAGAAAAGAGAAPPAAPPPPPPPPHHGPLAMPGGVGPGRAHRELARFDAEFDRAYLELMRKKLGLLLVADDGGSGGGEQQPPPPPPQPQQQQQEGADAGAPKRGGDRALVSSLLDVMEATGADYARTMRRLRLVPLERSSSRADGDDNNQDDDDDGFGGFLSADFLARDLPPPAELADAIASNLPPEANVRALSALARRDAAFAHALGVPREALDRLLERHRACAALREMAAAAAEEGDGGRAAKREGDARRWRAWLGLYRRRLQAEAEAAVAAAASAAAKEAAVRGAAEARRVAMDASNAAVVLREEELRAAVGAAEKDGNDGGAQLRALFRRLQRPFEHDDQIP